MKNKTLLSPIKRVSFFVAMTLNIQGCALLRVDGTNFDDIDGPNAGNPYDRNAQTANNRAEGGEEENDRQNRLLSAISHQDILLGMDQSQVMASWGSPRDVETAGSNGSGAERWLYYSGNSLTYGMNRPRIVYFENGHVVGWESATR